jgi:hypothetical protein
MSTRKEEREDHSECSRLRIRCRKCAVSVIFADAPQRPILHGTFRCPYRCLTVPFRAYQSPARTDSRPYLTLASAPTSKSVPRNSGLCDFEAFLASSPSEPRTGPWPHKSSRAWRAGGCRVACNWRGGVWRGARLMQAKFLCTVCIRRISRRDLG